MTQLPAFVLYTALAAALPAQAQKITPGLWEHSATLKASGGEVQAAQAKMQAQMAALPPEQRKMMESMMAQRGVQVTQLGGGGKPTISRVCITPEMAARDELPMQDNCKLVSHQRSGNTVTMKFECAGQPPTVGEGTFTLISDKATRGQMHITGGGSTMDVSADGRWLGADCGGLKPVRPASK